MIFNVFLPCRLAEKLKVFRTENKKENASKAECSKASSLCLYKMRCLSNDFDILFIYGLHGNIFILLFLICELRFNEQIKL